MVEKLTIKKNNSDKETTIEFGLLHPNATVANTYKLDYNIPGVGLAKFVKRAGLLSPFIDVLSDVKAENTLKGSDLKRYQKLKNEEHNRIVSPNVQEVQDVVNAQTNNGYLKYGGTINYDGQLHEGPNGGVPVDGLGNVDMNNPAALVEKGEVSYMNPNKETYVFSDTLKFDRNRTFAKEAKNVQSKLKLRMKNGKVTDPIASRYYDKEMDKLTEAQEKLREYTGLEEKIKSFRRGGILPKYDGLNNTQYLLKDPQIDLNRYDEFVDQVNMDYPSRSRISPNLNAKVTTTSPVLPTRSEIRNDLNKDANNNPVTYEPYTGMSSGQMWASATPSLIASGIGLASELINKRTPRRLSLARMTPQQISLDRSRQTAKEEANVARANISRGVRAGAPTSGSYMANMIAGETGIQRELGKQLGESYTQEELTNAQYRQQADAANLEISARETEYNTQAENMFDEARRSRINQYVSQGLTGVSNAISSKYQSERDADYLNMLNPNYGVFKDPKTGRRVYRPRP